LAAVQANNSAGARQHEVELFSHSEAISKAEERLFKHRRECGSTQVEKENS
jgi:hypothetical protein